MRVIAGSYGGRRLKAPRGLRTRPTADRVREALFSSLGSLEGLIALDLFAGSGALGIEAISRGASSVCFIDNDARAVGTIRDNLATLGITADVHKIDSIAYLMAAKSKEKRFDLVFIDPPYRQAGTLQGQLSATLPDVLTQAGRVVCESDRRNPLELDMNLQLQRRYGDTLIRTYVNS